MGMHYGMIGVKTNDSEKLLDETNNYYQQFNLSLVEERIGKRLGKYVNSPRSYLNLQEYDNYNSNLTRGKNIYFTTNFDLFDSTGDNEKWRIFIYNPRLAKYTLNINSAFASFLSEKFPLAIEYFEYDVTCQVIVRSHENGSTKDRFSTADLEVYDAAGFFEQYMGKQCESYDDVFTIIRTYFKNIGFNFESPELDDLYGKSRRPMYLKGKPEDIKDFLLLKQEVF